MDRIETDHVVGSSRPDLGQTTPVGEPQADAGVETGSPRWRRPSRLTPLPPRRAVNPDGEIGPYRLVRRIGEGGMGVVYEAEQREPVHRVVALKVIRGGFDSREVIARFAFEHQALATLSHANVAKLYAAGTTAGGQPYFAMEYVPGVPITRFADERRLGVRQRLELFVQVCDAICTPTPRRSSTATSNRPTSWPTTPTASPS